MAQSGYTPILIYASGTATNVPLAANLTSTATGVELALNYADGKLYYKNGSGVVTLLAQSAAASPVTSFQTSLSGLTPSSSTTGAVTLAGTLGVSSGGTGVTASSGANSVVLRDANANVIGNSFTPGWTSTTTAAGTTTLTVGSTYYQRFIGSTTQTVVLPSATTVALGQGFIIDNDSSGTLTLQDGAAGALGSVVSGMAAFIFCENNGTTAGSWSGYMFVPGAGPAGQVTWGTSGLSLGGGALSNTTQIRETATVSATAATGTVNFDIITQVVLYYTTNASGNFTVNFRGNSSSTLDSVMSTGQSLSATFLVTNGSTAYYNSAVTIDGNSITPKWQGGTAPTSGDASAIDSYTYVILKTGSATFTVLASQTKFA